MSPMSLIRHRARRAHRREEGQAAFEFMIMLPFFVLFLLMAIDFGVLMYQYVSVSNAVREGARFGAVNCGIGACNEADIIDRVLDRSSGTLSDPSDVTVSWVDGPDDGADVGNRGDSIVVIVHHDHDLLFFPRTFDVRSCADMRLEQADNGSISAGTGCN